MIDPITEQILLEDRVYKDLKNFIMSMKKAILRKDLKHMSFLSRMLPEVGLKSFKKWAFRLPNFREKYEEARRAIIRSHVLDKEVYEPATAALAVVAATTNKSCAEILRRGNAGIPQGKVLAMLLPGSQFVMPMLKLNFFILAIMSVYVTGGDIILPAVTGLFKAIGYLLGLVGKGFKAIGHTLAKATDQMTVEKAVDQVNDMMGTNLKPPKVFGLEPELVEKMKAAGIEFGGWGGEHLPGTAGLFFKTKK